MVQYPRKSSMMAVFRDIFDAKIDIVANIDIIFGRGGVTALYQKNEIMPPPFHVTKL